MSPSTRRPSSHRQGSHAGPRRKPQRASDSQRDARRPWAVATTAALALSMAGLAVVHRAPDPHRTTSTSRVISTTAQLAELVCPPAPKLAATRTDKQFDPGRGVDWAQSVGTSIGSTTSTFGSTTLPLGQSSGPATPAPTPTASRTSSAGPSTTTAEPSEVGTEVPRPSQTVPTTASSGNAGTRSTPAAAAQSPARSVGPLLMAVQSGIPVQALVARPVLGEEPLVGGTSVALSGSGDLRGISAAACQTPSESAWLVGGHSGAGVGSRVSLANASDAPATVDLKLLTPNGTLAPPAGTGIVVAPHSAQEVLLRSLTPSQKVVAVGVTAAGAPVAAFLVDQRVDGTTPAGVDVVASSQPAKRQVLIGRTSSAQGAVLRLAVPGSREATVAYRVEDLDGTVGTPQAVTVAGGACVDLTLPDGPESATRIVVDSDQPVVAGLELTRRAGGASDRAWVPSSPLLDSPVVVPIPKAPGVSASLVISGRLASGSSGRLTVSRYDDSGKPLPDITVTPNLNGAVEVPASAVGGASTLVLKPGQPLYASLNLEAKGRDGQNTLFSTVSIPPAAGSAIDSVVQHAAPGDWP